MKKIVIKSLILAGLFFALGFDSSAQTATPKVTDRQVIQSKRVSEGVRSGELTRRETKQIVRQQKNIQRTKKLAKADGKVTLAERAIIENKQDRASRNIARKKHNGRERIIE
jgi:hypothetical protein